MFFILKVYYCDMEIYPLFYTYNFNDFKKISKKTKKSDEIIRPVYIKDFYTR